MNPHRKQPDQPEVNDPPPSKTGGMRGDNVESIPTEGVPIDDGTKSEGEKSLD
jgi:hypothetical protein